MYKLTEPFRTPLLKILLVQGLILLLIGSIELYFWINEPTEDQVETLIDSSLEKAKKGFYDEIQVLEDKTVELAESFKENDYQTYTRHINRDDDIDFIVLDSLKRIINWSEKAPNIPFAKIIPRGNVYRISIKDRDYFAYTDERETYSVTGIILAQNSLSNQIGDNRSTYSIISKWISNLDYPVQLRFLAKDVWSAEKKIELSVGESKVIGYLAGYPNSLSLLAYHWNVFTARVRAIYQIAFVLFSIIMFMYVSRVWPLTERFLLRSVLIVLLWLVTAHSEIELHLTDLFIQWGFDLKRSLSISLININFHTLFFSLLAYEIIRTCRLQRRYFGIDWYPRTLLFSFISGLLTYLVISLIPSAYFHLISTNEITLLDPNLFPPIETLLFIAGLTATAAFALLLSIIGNSFIFESEKDQLSLVYPTHLISFFGIHFIFRWLSIGHTNEFSHWISIVFSYALIITFAEIIRRNPRLILHYSALRLLLIGSFALTALLYPTIHLRYQKVQEDELNEKAWALISDLGDPETWKESIKPAVKSITMEHDRGVWPGSTYIAVYDDKLTLSLSWNRIILPFSESGKLPLNSTEIQEIKEGVKLHKNLIYESQLFIDHYFYVKESDVIIRGIIPVIPFQSHIFSFFRFFYTTLFLLLLMYFLRAFFSNKSILFFNTRENLQSRILDSYIVASLMFLVALVGATGYSVLSDEKENHQQLLNQKKEQIIQSINQDLNGNLDRPFLRFLANRFEVSLDVYDPRKWEYGASYQNIPVTDSGYLLERSIYETLVMREDIETTRWYDYGKEQIGSSYLKVNLNNKDFILKISLRSTVSGDNEQLLKTVSFLIAVYVFVFGLFIVLAYFISTYLADPLLRLLQGLRRISSGRLDTIVPVTTQDEIGELANAYNFMIFRLKDLQKELAEVERQAAWTEMARQVAHEIKNPLTPMKLSLQHLQRLVLMSDEDEENLKPAFERISKNLIQQIDSLSTIASDFSKFAQPQTEELVPVDLNKLLSDIDELYQHDQFIKINLDLSENILEVLGIADDLKRVFINLIKNSIEAMPNGGIIIVRTYRYKTEAYIEFADTGVGIPVDIQKRVFQPNFSTKSSGTGIGLAICKKVVDAHGGVINFASVPGSGTTFTLNFRLTNNYQDSTS